ncbi:MAG: hypothetical protein OEX02_19105 [Cyclobacteriaceae bacterium]|nr:hypothetical protein [Cyclobacteriaceae bacterium]
MKSLYLQKSYANIMDIQTRKLHFIQEILALSNEKIIEKLEGLLKLEKLKEDKKPSVYDLLGVISEKEADKMKKVIEESCENIHAEDWK